jgi:hypothetical protein
LKACLPNVDLTTLTDNAVYYQHLQSHVILDRPKGTRYFPGKEAHRLDVVPRQHPADSVKYRPNIRLESDWVWLFIRLGNPRERVDRPMNLHKLHMKAVLIIQSCVPWWKVWHASWIGGDES